MTFLDHVSKSPLLHHVWSLKSLFLCVQVVLAAVFLECEGLRKGCAGRKREEEGDREGGRKEGRQEQTNELFQIGSGLENSFTAFTDSSILSVLLLTLSQDQLEVKA